MSTEQANSTSGLSAREHETGNVDASVTLVEYGDFECPMCTQAEPLTRHLVDTYGARLRFVFRHYPSSAHPHAELAAEAAEAAAAQGKFWDMHAMLFRHSTHLSAKAMSEFAEEIGLDMARFHNEMADHVYLQRVREHHAAAVALGLRGTPSFFVNDEPVDVSFGLNHLEDAVRTALGVA